ncbi:DgyrCDS12693 [Dimorphilus gyrociliatus]|nr:DgyrCDS12693 [Dimorphilus gyrociliatus]
MGDVVLTRPNKNTNDRVPIMTKVYRSLERAIKVSRRASVQNPTNNNKESKEYLSYKLKKRNSFLKKFTRQSSNTDDREEKAKKKEKLLREKFDNEPTDYLYDSGPAGVIANLPATEMEILHFIIGHAILRKDIRDELFCQVCKQLTNNKKADSCKKGWVLLSLISGCVVPSGRLFRYIRCFLRDAPKEYHDYSKYTRKIISRTAANGMRYHPPNWLEYQTSLARQYIVLPITFADGRLESIEGDSATTSAELCNRLANKIGLKDFFGFSIFIRVYDKISSLGSGMDHVMDAISECEQVVFGRGQKTEDAPWKIFFRKEMFSPWHDPSYDLIATELIFVQIMKGIRLEEYKVRSEEELARYAAIHYFIDNGCELDEAKLSKSLSKYLSENCLKWGRTQEGWTQAITSSFHEVCQEGKDTGQFKQEIVTEAPKKWVLQFAGLFEAFRIGGPKLTKNDVIVAVAANGFYILDEPYKIKAVLYYYNIVEVFASRAGKVRGQSFTLITIKGDEWTFISPNSQTITKLISTFLDGLRRRSKYAVGLQDFILETKQSKFSFSQGDVIQLVDEDSQREHWSVGINEKTKVKGCFPFDSVYVIPSLERPPDEFLNTFVNMKQDTLSRPKKRGAVVLSTGTIGRHNTHGLDTVA